MSCYTCTMNKGNETLTVARKKDSEAAWTVLETNTMDATSSAVPLFSFPTRTMAVTPEHEQQEDDEDQQDKDNTRTRVFDFQEGTRMLQDASGEHSISNSRRRHDSFSRSHTDAASYDVVSIHSSIDSEEQEQDDDDKPHHETQLQLQIRLQLDRMTSFLYSSPSSSLTKHANVNNASSTSIISEIDSHYHDHHHSLMTSMNMDSRNISMSIGTPEKTYTTLPSLPESDVFFLPSEIASLSCYSHPLTTSGISEIDDDDDDNSASFLFSQEEDLPVPVDEYDEDKKTMLTIQPRPPLSEIPIPSMIMPHTSNQHNIQKFARETRTRATVNNSNKKWINNNTFQSKKQHERLTLQHPDVAPTTRTNLKPKSPSELSSPESTSTRNLKFDLVDDEDRSSKNKSQTSLKAHDRHEDQIIALSTSMAALEICDAIAEASLNVTMVTPEHPQQDSLSSPCSSDDSLSCPTHKNHMMMDIRDDPSPLLFSCATCGVQEETIRRQQEDIGYYQLILNQVLAHLQHTVQGGDENKNQVHDAAGDFKKGKQQHPSAPYLSIDVKATEKMIHDLQLASDHATASHHHSPTQKHTDHEPRASTMLLYNHDPPNSGDLCLLSTPVTIRNHVVQDHEEFFHGLPMEGGQAPMRGDYQGHTPPSPILKQIELASFDPELKPYAAFNSAGDPDAEQVAPRGLEEQATAALTSASVMENAAVLPKHNQFPVEVDTELPGLSQLQPTACVSEHENQDSVSGSLFIVDMPNEDSHEQEGSASISKYRRSSASVPEHSRAGEDWEKQTREVQERMTLLQTDTENACLRVEELETQKTEADRRITVSQGIIHSLRQANLEVKSSKVQVDTELEGLQSKHSKLEAQLHASDKQVKTLHVGKETLGTRVHELESQATELKALVDEKIELLQSLQYEKAATSDAHAALEIAITHAKSQLQVSNEDTRQANNDKEDLAAQSSELESALEEAKTKSIDLECQLKESQGTTDSLRAEIETRTSYIEQKEAASAETSKRLEDAHNKCAQLEDLLKDTQGEVTAFGAMITSKESKIEELESSMIEKERLGDSLKMHLQLLQIEKGSLESQLAELEDEKERMDLLQTDTENACRRVEELETQKTEANRRITVSQGIILSLRQANLEVKSSKVQVDTELEGLQSKHSKLEAQLHASDKQVKTLHVGKETLGTRVHELESQATELKALVDEKIELLQSLQYEKAATSDAHAALEIAITHAKSQLQVSNEDTRQANNDKEDLAAQSSELESALEEAKTKSIDLECQLKESQGTTDSLRAEIETRTSYIEQKEAASAETSKRLEDAHNKCAQLEDLLKDTQGEVTAFGAMITSKESKIEELESSMIKKERLGDGLKMHLQLLRIEKGSLESQLAELEDEKDETKFQLEGVKAESIYSHREKAKALCRVSEFESTRGESEALRLQLESRNDELQEHLEESESDIKTIAAEKEAASIHIARLLSETAELKKSSQETNFALVVLEEYLSDTLDEIASLKLEREALHSQMADKETAVTGVESRLEDMEKQIGDLNKTTGDTSKELERVEAEALALKTLNEALLKRSQRVENDKIASDALAELIRSKHAKLESKLLESNARMTALLVQIEGIGSPNEAFESSCGSVPVLHSASKESADNEDFWGRIEQAIASKSFREKAKADSKLQELARMKDDAQNMLHKTEFKLAEGQSQLKIADDKTRDLATELAASHAQVGRTQEASDNLKIRLAEVESQKIEVEGRLESMDGFVGFLEAEKLILSFSAKDMELEKRRVQFLLQESESQTTALEIQFKEQKQSYDMVCADKQDKEVRIEELLLEKGSIEAELGRTKEEIASLKSENASFTMKVGNLKGTNEKLQTELDKTRKEVGVFRVVIVMLQAQQQTLSLAKLEAYASFKEATEKNTEVSERLRGAEQQISVLRAELSASTLQGIALSREKKELEEVSGAGKRRPKSELQGRLSDFDAEIPAIERDDNSRVMDSHVVENGKERGISSSASSSSEPRLDKGEFATFSPKPQVASLSTPTSLEKVASRVRQMEIELDLYYLDDKFYKQKAKYSGALRHGLPDGMGVLWFESGDLYVGEFHLGEMHGVGAFNHKRRDHHRKQLKSKHQIFKGGFVHNEFVGPLPPIRRVLVSKIPDSPIRNNEGTKSSQSTPKNTPRANLSECSDSDRSSAITSGARKLLNPTRIHKATFGL